MIKYYYKPSTKETFAVLDNCAYDAVSRIAKIVGDTDLCFNVDKYVMPNSFRVKVKLADGDVESDDTARKYAKDKLMRKYYKCFDAKIDMFRSSLIMVNSKAFDNDFLNENT